jgi:hypothetical protein
VKQCVVRKIVVLVKVSGKEVEVSGCRWKEDD